MIVNCGAASLQALFSQVKIFIESQISELFIVSICYDPSISTFFFNNAVNTTCYVQWLKVKMKRNFYSIWHNNMIFWTMGYFDINILVYIDISIYRQAYCKTEDVLHDLLFQTGWMHGCYLRYPAVNVIALSSTMNLWCGYCALHNCLFEVILVFLQYSRNIHRNQFRKECCFSQ